MVSINVFFLKKQRKRASQSALVPSVGDAHCPFCMIRFPNVPGAHLNMISNSFPTASRISRTRRGLVVDQVKSAVVLAYPDIPRVGGWEWRGQGGGGGGGGGLVVASPLAFLTLGH